MLNISQNESSRQSVWQFHLGVIYAGFFAEVWVSYLEGCTRFYIDKSSEMWDNIFQISAIKVLKFENLWENFKEILTIFSNDE